MKSDYQDRKKKKVVVVVSMTVGCAFLSPSLHDTTSHSLHPAPSQSQQHAARWMQTYDDWHCRWKITPNSRKPIQKVERQKEKRKLSLLRDMHTHLFSQSTVANLLQISMVTQETRSARTTSISRSAVELGRVYVYHGWCSPIADIGQKWSFRHCSLKFPAWGV